jgi:hypothetical protein
MSDNISLPQGPGTLLATDEILGVHVIRAKVQFGADGAADDVSSENPLPVSLVSLPSGTSHLGTVDIVTLPDVTIATALPAGTNAIGSVTVLSLPSITVGSALPAGTNTIGSVNVLSLPALPVGSNAIGTVAVSSLPSVTIGAALPTGSNVIGQIAVTSVAAGTNTIGAVNVKPTTSGGLSAYRQIGLGTTGQLVKSSPGQVFGWHISNTGTGGAFIKLYNLAAAPTVGTSTPMLTLYVAGNSVSAVEHINGITFSNGIGAGATTGVGDTDASAPGSNVVVVNLFYK